MDNPEKQAAQDEDK